jgi:hypothetical protein
MVRLPVSRLIQTEEVSDRRGRVGPPVPARTPLAVTASWIRRPVGSSPTAPSRTVDHPSRLRQPSRTGTGRRGSRSTAARPGRAPCCPPPDSVPAPRSGPAGRCLCRRTVPRPGAGRTEAPGLVPGPGKARETLDEPRPWPLPGRGSSVRGGAAGSSSHGRDGTGAHRGDVGSAAGRAPRPGPSVAGVPGRPREVDAVVGPRRDTTAAHRGTPDGTAAGDSGSGEIPQQPVVTGSVPGRRRCRRRRRTRFPLLAVVPADAPGGHRQVGPPVGDPSVPRSTWPQHRPPESIRVLGAQLSAVADHEPVGGRRPAEDFQGGGDTEVVVVGEPPGRVLPAGVGELSGPCPPVVDRPPEGTGVDGQAVVQVPEPYTDGCDRCGRDRRARAGRQRCPRAEARSPARNRRRHGRCPVPGKP